MAKEKKVEEIEIHPEDGEGEALIPEEESVTGEEVFEYDEDGTILLGRPLTHAPTLPRPVITEVAAPKLVPYPCSLQALNGSWYIQLVPKYKIPFCKHIRGPMRIEAGCNCLRISGDIYVTHLECRPLLDEPITPLPLIIRKNWYPHFPFREYRWYFRSAGVRYSRGVLEFKFVRHLWDTGTEEFNGTDFGWMRLYCNKKKCFHPRLPQSTIRIIGEAMIGCVPYHVVVHKTSPYYRGAHVEVDVMKNRKWPFFATSCDGNQSFTFTGVYRDTGLDFRAVVSDVDIPEDPFLTIPELHALLTAHRDIPSIGHSWRVWLVIGSRMNGTLGIMFDGIPPFREGAAGFYDPKLPTIPIIEPSAQGKEIGKVPLAFLRTLIHEVGHVFNLFHPKHDVHVVNKGTTIMNQTGDVMGFATVANPYPCNATFGFNEHNRTSLIHSPDPQVAPGWKQFGWGHGSLSSGVPEPIDATGLDIVSTKTEDLRIEFNIPTEVFRGEFVIAQLTVTNVSDKPKQVTTALNLAEGDLRVRVTDAGGNTYDVRDLVIVCGDRRLKELKPGDSITGNVQFFYTNQGHTFNQIGRYVLQAELDVGDVDGTVVRSAPVEVFVRPAISEQERELAGLTMDKGIGRSLAMGDFGADNAVQEKLSNIVDRFAYTDTGAACGMVLANTLARDLRDVRAGRTIRSKNEAEAGRILDIVLKGRDASTIARLSCAVVSPREIMAPLLDQVQNRLKKAAKGAYTKEDLKQAEKVLSDHLA